MHTDEKKSMPSFESSNAIKTTILKDESVLILSQFYWPEQIGTPLYVTDFAEWITERAKEVSVVTGRPYYPEFQLKSGYEHGQRDIETKEGVSIVRLPTYVPTGGKAVKRVVSELFFLLGVLSRVASRKIKRHDYVVSFSPSIVTVLGGILCTAPGGRHLAVIHDIQSGLAAGLGLVGSGFILRLFRYLEKFVLNRVDVIIVLSPNMKRILRKQGVHTPITVLPLWVDPDEFKLAPIRQEKTPVIQYSGNLGRKQGIEQVLDMAEILLKKRPEIRILIRGGGSQFDFVHREIKHRGLINTELSPLLPREQLPEGLSEADIHLVPQNPKAADFAVPSKIYAIMAVGRPIVATALPGSALWNLQEQTNRAIVCVPPNKTNELSKIVIELLDEEIVREEMGRNGRRYVEMNARRDAVIKKYSLLLFSRA